MAGEAILDLSDYVNLVTGGNSGTPEAVWYAKEPRINGAAAVATIAGRLTSMFQWDGQPSGASATAPTTSAVLTNATTGSMRQTSPGGGRTKRLSGLAIGGLLAAGTLLVYDRLVQQGGLSGTTTSAQTTNLPTSALTRYTDGVGVQAWLEIYTQIGTTDTTVTASYTDQGGTSGNTTLATAFGATGFREANRIVRLPVAGGDYGVRAVASVTVLASTGTAGAFGVVLARPLYAIPLPNLGVGFIKSLVEDPAGPVDIKSDSCLALAWSPNGTTAPQVHPSAFFFLEK